MNMKNQNEWNQVRAAWRPAPPPTLDTAALMAAVRAEAAARPVRRAPEALAASIPAWVCAAAAALALMATTTAVVRSVDKADSFIGQAWLHSVEPAEFETNILPSGSPLFFYFRSHPCATPN